ncbi:hypothetical protein ACQY0O_003337 [Thecaphora frezii]
MAFVAPAVRWPDAVAPYLPEAIRESAIPPQYFLIVPATLAALVLTYTLTKGSQQLESAHLAASSSSRSGLEKRSWGKTPTVLLVGLSQSGKTALFSDLVYGAVPNTLPSQKESQGLVEPARFQKAGEGVKPTMLVDLPGHPRLRPKVDEHLSQADGIVICIDATLATKPASAKLEQDANDVAAAADLIHATLTSLAKQRLRSSSTVSVSAPSVLVLFTRSDLSTLLSSTSADAAKDAKRRQQLLSRCRTAIETELGNRRAGMGLGRRNAGVRIAGVGKVVDSEPSSLAPSGGIIGWFERVLGLSSLWRGSTGQEDEDEDEEDAETLDYVDWRAARREAAQTASQQSGGLQGGNTFSLEKLDEEVVWGGKVQWGLVSVGKERSWEKVEMPAEQDGLGDLKAWLVGLQLD